jgi:hypothetical protein
MSQEAETVLSPAETYRMQELERMAEQDIRQMWKIFRMLGNSDAEIQSEFRIQIDKRASQTVN